MLIGTTLIPESLNINDDDSPVNGQPLILHRLHPAMTRHKPGSINPSPTVDLAAAAQFPLTHQHDTGQAAKRQKTGRAAVTISVRRTGLEML
jgi:hypothetical protein